MIAEILQKLNLSDKAVIALYKAIQKAIQNKEGEQTNDHQN